MKRKKSIWRVNRCVAYLAPGTEDALVTAGLQRFVWWRCLVVAAVVAVLASLPSLIAAFPARVAGGSIDELYAKVTASGSQVYQGFVVSSGTAGLPSLPQLADPIALLNGETRLRAWYAGPDRWRVDQ